MIPHIIRKHLEKRILGGIILIFCLCLISVINADCGTPLTYLNANFQWNSSTVVGSSAVYSCNDGYQMSGPADHIVLVCSSEEEWTGPDINCTEKIFCSLPPSPAFGSYNVTESGFAFQSSVTFQCQTGYTLHGPENITCTASGEWLMEDEEYIEPMCKRSCTQEKYRYQYHECYERMDSTGDWYSAKLSCESEGGQLATIKDTARQSFIGSILSDNTYLYWIGGYELDRDWKYPSDGQYAIYFNWASGEPNTPGESCVYLSNVNGADDSLKWNDEFCDKSIIDMRPQIPIFCICEIDGNCSTLSTTHSKYQYENKCLLFIDDTPINHPSSITMCTDGFGGNLVEIKNQNMQDFIENVINDNGFETANWWIGLEEGFDRTWTWVDGERIETFFWAEGEPSHDNEKCLDILTNKDYKWNDDFCGSTNRKYICQYGEPKCGNPGIPYHGNMTSVKKSYSVGDTVYLSCNDGYVLSDPLMERLTCQNDSTWSASVPSCQKINCSGPVPNIPNTISNAVATVYRGITVYECLHGNYLLDGYPVSVCQEDGTWSIPNMTCTEILTTQKYPTAPQMTTFIATPYQSTKLVPSTEHHVRGHTTETTEIIESSPSPSIQQTEILDQTETIQPTTMVDLMTSLDDLATDGGTTAKNTLLTLTPEIYKTETTSLGRFDESTQESFSLSTDRDFLTTYLFTRETEFETRQSSNSALTSNSIISTQSFTSVMSRDETEVTDITEVQSHTSAERVDKSTGFVTTDTSRDTTLTSDSLFTTISPLFSSNTDTSPAVESLTTLLQSTEMLHTSVGTNTNDLEEKTTEVSSTNDSETTKLTTTFSSESSIQTNSLSTSDITMTPSQDSLSDITMTPSQDSLSDITMTPSQDSLSDITMTPSQDSLHTMMFSSSELSSASFTGQERSTLSITNDFQSTTLPTSKTTGDSIPTTHQLLPESTEGSYWTNSEPFTNGISSFPPTYLTDSSVSKNTDATTLISQLITTDRLASFSTEESPTDQTARKISSPDTPLRTTAFSSDVSTELSRTQRTTSKSTKVTDEVFTTSHLHSTSFLPSTPKPVEYPSSSLSISRSPTSEAGKSDKLSENYSKEPETTQQPSNKGLIIGLSVTSAVIGIGICIWLFLFVVFEKYPKLIKKRNKVHPTDSESNFVKEAITENDQEKTRKEESLQEYTTLPMNDIPSRDTKPYLYNSNEAIDYI